MSHSATSIFLLVMDGYVCDISGFYLGVVEAFALVGCYLAWNDVD
jgi:hypothetical protein